MFRSFGKAWLGASHKKPSGQTVILLAGGLVMLIGFVGLAIDAGRAYLVSSQLSKAVDAAVLAGAKISGDGQAIREGVQRAFNVNFPVGYMGMNGRPKIKDLEVNPEFQEPGTSYTARRIFLSAEATLPVTFLKVLKFRDVTIPKSGVSLRRVMDVLLLIDRSASIGERPFEDFLKPAMIEFLNLFDPEIDRVGILSFAGNVRWLGVRPSQWGRRGFDLEGLQKEIETIDMAGWTATGPAMSDASAEIEALQRDASNFARWKVILLFTDGTPNTIYFNPEYFDPQLGRINFSLARCRDRVDQREIEWCGSEETECALTPGRGNEIRWDPVTQRGGVHLSAGEEDNPIPERRHFIFGLYRHESREQSPCPQQYDIYHEWGFLAEPDFAIMGCPVETDRRYPDGSLVYSLTDQLIEGCADPRKLIEHSPDGSDIGRRRLPVIPGRELPFEDVRKISFRPQVGGGWRNVDFPLPLNPPLKRWDEFRRKINGMARNYLENAANTIRGTRDINGNGVTIYTIGLNGEALQMETPNREWNRETGRDICKRVANVPDADTYNPGQPTGLFVEAQDATQLSMAFTTIGNTILRLSN